MDTILREINELNLVGNILPHCWYSKIKLPSGKPDLLGMVVLSEIVYWYRPVVVKCENTGSVIGYRKKFAADMLQRSLTSFAEQFGESKRRIAEALKRLEKSGLIIKELRTIDTAMGRIGNVLYLAPIAQAIKGLESDFELVDEFQKNGCEKETLFFSRGIAKWHNQPSLENYIPSYQNTYEGIPQIEEGGTQKRSKYTKITTKKKAAAKGCTRLSNNDLGKKRSMSAAAFSGENKCHTSNLDNELGDKLTSHQIDKVNKLAEVASSKLQRSPDQIYQEIEYVLLCKASFTYAGNDFTKKLNTIISVIKKGQWTVPAAAKADKVKHLDAKIDPLMVEKNDAESEISHWSRMLKHAKRMNCSQTIKNCERAIDVAKQKLKVCIESCEKIRQEEVNASGEGR